MKQATGSDKAVTIKPSDRRFFIKKLSEHNNQPAATANQKLVMQANI